MKSSSGRKTSFIHDFVEQNIEKKYREQNPMELFSFFLEASISVLSNVLTIRG